ncbi:MAG: bifunctional phosphopantothenoylcysteine decarboxylase/phosphopantothenate--cysteine ligase CoaBC [Coriobacteriia bacterium]|nr:bifunctional phosphopantothenoylcysteine decarboxylase/phosphopantothenate--cysteine ligase CoaBC [Coriobacteriia bacterium]
MDKRVLLGVTGSIAAYKACELVRLLVKEDIGVQVVMTAHATELMGPATFRSLSGNPVALDLFDDPGAPIHHIELAQSAPVFVIAPCTANVVNKLAAGVADDLLTTTALAFTGRLILAPAANTQMYLDVATQESIRALQARGVTVLTADNGELACGDVGPGRLPDPRVIADEARRALRSSEALAGRHVVITAGPTREDFDPVRFVSNHSTGRMGYALARAALQMGATVTLISGPVSLPAPVDARLEFVGVTSAREMSAAVLQAAATADIVLAAAAVADFRPRITSEVKLKKYALSELSELREGETVITVELVQNPDIVTQLSEARAAGALKRDLVLVGFAAETNDVDSNAREKLASKGLDFIVANDVSRADIGFGAAENEVLVISPEGDTPIAKASKFEVAWQLLELITQATNAS